VVEAAPSIEGLQQQKIGSNDLAIENVIRAITRQRAEFRLPADRTSHPARVVVLIDERGDGMQRRRSVAASLFASRLHEAGFRVIADHELGRTNVELLRAAIDRGQFLTLNPALAIHIDIVVAGWCETRLGSDNLGWAASVLADADIRAIKLSTGEVIAARSIFGRPGFGEHEDRATVDALRAVADEIAEEIAVQMGAGDVERATKNAEMSTTEEQ
jgi:hypothetical protein